MEILQFLLSFLSKNNGLEGLKPIISLFQNGKFNLSDLLKNLTPQTLKPIIERLFKSNSFKNQNPTENSVGNNYGLNPIAPFADKDIVYSLNKYFYSTV